MYYTVLRLMYILQRYTTELYIFSVFGLNDTSLAPLARCPDPLAECIKDEGNWNHEGCKPGENRLSWTYAELCVQRADGHFEIQHC